jgi:DNA-binding MurR/RpiR family transcriptional regulator
MNLRNRFETFTEKLTRSERQFLDFFSRNFDELPFLSAADIAANLNLNASGLTRFAQRFGFDGYPDLQRAVRLELRETLAPTFPVKGDAAHTYWTHEKRNLEQLSKLPPELIDQAVTMMCEAKTLWITGARTSYALAYYVAQSMDSLRSEVRLIAEDAVNRPESLLDVSKGDVLLAFTLRRYSSSTRHLSEYMLQRGAKLLLITDTGSSALMRRANLLLRVPTKSVKPFDSPSTVMSLAHGLFTLAAQRIGTKRMKQAERALEEFSVFDI